MLKRTSLIILALLVVLTASRADAVNYTRVTVAATATLIASAPVAGISQFLVRNPSAVSVYVGDVNVTTANGFEIAAGDAMSINLGYGDKLYGVVAAATQVVYTISGANPQ